MRERNPYAISFGRIPNQYIRRSLLIDDIIDTLDSDIVQEQAFKLTGVRGCGKTVTLTAIANQLKDEKEWIVINIRSNADITNELVAYLYANVPFMTKYIDANLNLSAFGIGVSLSKEQAPVSSLSVILGRLMKEVKAKKKKILVVIDEARKTDALIDFIQEFQILIREEYPIYLLVAGLYDDIEDLETTKGLTFFLRAEKYEIAPLNIGIIKEDYKETLGLTEDVAYELAVMTKGYAFAYQAFGKYMWEEKAKKITPRVLAMVDEALAVKAYDEIWRELRPQDRWFLEFIAQKETMSANELLEMTKKKHNEWSEPKKRMIGKGAIDGAVRGVISLKLPRFKEYIANQLR